MRVFWVILLLFRGITSKNQIQILNGKFSGLYYDLNMYLEKYERNIPYSKAQSKQTCIENGQCQEKYEYSVCDEFFIKDTPTGEPRGNGSYCVRKPVIENNLGLISNRDGVGLLRCTNHLVCGENGMCLMKNSLSDGFCVNLNICSRNRAASFNPNQFNPGHRWNCIDFSISDAFILLHPKNGIERGSRTVNACCSEPIGAQCVHGNVLDPLKSCLDNSDCFTKIHEPTEWCDDKTKVCCSDQIGDENIRCPDTITYPFIEPKCEYYDEMIPTSGNCSTNEYASCLHGHCCPTSYFDATEKPHHSYNITYETSIPCHKNKSISRQSFAFCDHLTRKIVILSKEVYIRLNESRGEDCENNNECDGFGWVCVWGLRTKKGFCTTNPVSYLTFNTSSNIIAFFITSTILLLISFLIIQLSRPKTEAPDETD